MLNTLFATGQCSNKECQYLHIDPMSKIKDCPWFDRGFCKHGRNNQILCTGTVILSHMLQYDVPDCCPLTQQCMSHYIIIKKHILYQ